MPGSRRQRWIFRDKVRIEISAPANQASLVEEVRIGCDQPLERGAGCERKYQCQYAPATWRLVSMNIA